MCALRCIGKPIRQHSSRRSSWVFSILALAALLCGCSSPRREGIKQAPQAITPSPDPSCVFASFAGHDYWFCKNPRSFDDAQQHCRAAGMDLSSIDDGKENDFVRDHARPDVFFIGLTDHEHGAAWKWTADGRLTWCGGDDGRGATGDSYTNWDAQEPTTSNCRYTVNNGRAYWFCD